MEFRVLGPLEVLDNGRPVEIAGQKPRALLAVLLLHAGEVVSRDRIVDALWGESPPPSAAKTLQAHVSRLRRALGDEASALLETRGSGYRLVLEPGALDADAFRATLEEARRALAAGDPEHAAADLEEAFGLWRGAPLADFAYEAFAQDEIARLEELRLSAVETRIDAELALARHAQLIPELESLVRAHPLRERPRAQLMVALYRAGRQADALDAYQQGRRALAEELGLEPTEALRRLERGILEQDPALAAPRVASRPKLVPNTAWRRPWRLVVAGAIVLAVAVGAALVEETREKSIGTAGAIVLDPKTGAVRETLPLGSAPSNVAIGEGSAWVLDSDDRTITEVDLESRNVVRTFSTASVPIDVAVGANAVWVANGSKRKPEGGGSAFPESVSRLDASSGEVDETIELPAFPGGHEYGVLPGLSRQHLAVTPDAVWVIYGGGRVARIDPATNAIVATIEDVKAENIAAGEGEVWVAEQTGLAEIDPGANTVSRRVELDADSFGGLAIGAGSVWVADPFRGVVWRVDTGSKQVRREIRLATWVAGVAFGEGAAWATNEIGDAVYRIDPRTNKGRVVSRTSAPRGVDAAAGNVLVTFATPPSGDASLSASVCGAVVSSGRGTPDLLIVSDLPLKGDVRPYTRPMSRAIELALAQRDFEAGEFSVGYQSCDSATGQGGTSDFFRCGTNAKAYARNLRVVGVIGTYFTYCSYLQIPITNDAPGGPLAMISPSNTGQDLTDDDGLYPTGVRNYVRLAAADRLQAVAQAQLVRALNRPSLYTLSPRDGPYPDEFADDVRVAAASLGVETAGSATYNSEQRSFRALARRVARSRPGAVVVVDILVPGSAALIRELRAALGPEVPIVVPDGFWVLEDLKKLAGASARGLYVTTYGIPNADLPPRGRQFLAAFARTSRDGAGPDFSAAYGAQAVEILLDAIARSDGTRVSVTREVRRTNIDNGILGDIRFDPKGDLRRAPVTVFRVADGFEVDRVITARPELLPQP